MEGINKARSYEGTPEEFIKAKETLERYPGLIETLQCWSGYSDEPYGPMSFESVVAIAESDDEACVAIKQYLSGRWSPVYTLAHRMREKLAWAIADLRRANSEKR